MPKSKSQKQRIVEKLTRELSASKSVVFADYQGLTVHELQELRQQLREQGAVLRIVKNTLAEVAMRESELEVEYTRPDGPTAFAIGLEDEVAPAKILHDFAKKHEALELQSGYLGTKELSLEDVNALAKLPSKEEMIAKTVGTIKAPLTGFVNVLAGNVRGLVTVLGAIRDAKESA